MTSRCLQSTTANPSITPLKEECLNMGQRLIKKFKDWRALVKQRRIDRDSFARLQALDDEMLKDIGLTRGDVMWASSLPLSTNASAELEIIARRKK